MQPMGSQPSCHTLPELLLPWQSKLGGYAAGALAAKKGAGLSVLQVGSVCGQGKREGALHAAGMSQAVCAGQGRGSYLDGDCGWETRSWAVRGWRGGGEPV